MGIQLNSTSTSRNCFVFLKGKYICLSKEFHVSQDKGSYFCLPKEFLSFKDRTDFWLGSFRSLPVLADFLNSSSTAELPRNCRETINKICYLMAAGTFQYTTIAQSWSVVPNYSSCFNEKTWYDLPDCSTSSYIHTLDPRWRSCKHTSADMSRFFEIVYLRGEFVTKMLKN